MPGKIIYTPPTQHVCTGRPWAIFTKRLTRWRCDECDQVWEQFYGEWRQVKDTQRLTRSPSLPPADTRIVSPYVLADCCTVDTQGFNVEPPKPMPTDYIDGMRRHAAREQAERRLKGQVSGD